MNVPQDLEPDRQRAQFLSARLGTLAAALPRTLYRPPTGPHASPLAPILDSFRRPDTAQEHARHKLKANELVMAD